MMELPSYFKDFLSEIRLTSNQVNDMVTGHSTLRKRLKKDDELSKIMIRMFLQGSYGRFTAVRPKGKNKSDVDLVVVTKLDKGEYSPKQALELFVPFLEEHYEGKYRIQKRSLRISLSYVELDIVVTIAPSESEEGILQQMESLFKLSPQKMIMGLENPIVESNFEKAFALKDDSAEWKKVPLCLPDQEADKWIETHPLEQIRWTIKKNSSTNGHYINVVKALKWWRKEKYPEAGHPKSYPLEHFIGECCPDGIKSVAKGVASTLKKMAEYETKPVLQDRGVPDHDVFGRLSEEEYEEFHNHVSDAAILANEALNSDDKNESIAKWKELFGNKFPDPPQNNKDSGNKNGGFTTRTEKTANIPGRRFA